MRTRLSGHISLIRDGRETQRNQIDGTSFLRMDVGLSVWGAECTRSVKSMTSHSARRYGGFCYCRLCPWALRARSFGLVVVGGSSDNFCRDGLFFLPEVPVVRLIVITVAAPSQSPLLSSR